MTLKITTTFGERLLMKDPAMDKKSSLVSIALITLFAADYTDMENLIAWILTFGEKAGYEQAKLRANPGTLKNSCERKSIC